MEMKKIALIGAGAIGSYFIGGFTGNVNIDFCVVASGERKTRLEQQGIVVNGTRLFPVVKEPSEIQGPDLLLIATKYAALQPLLPEIKSMVGPHTTVLSLLNGIDSEEIVGSAIGMEHMLHSFMRIAAEREKNAITFNPDHTAGLFFGEMEHREPTERVLAIMSLMEQSGLHYRFEPDILTAQWKKYALNLSYNLPQAVLQVGAGAFEDSEHVRFLAEKIWNEVALVAAKKELVIPPYRADIRTEKKSGRYSTLQDLDAKRHTEVDMFAGTLVRLAKEYQVSVPFTEFTLHAIHALEEKNDGAFAYDL